MLTTKHIERGTSNYGALKYVKKRLCRQKCEDRIKTNKKLGFLGNGTMHARIGLRMHEFSLRVQARSCVHKSLSRKPNLHRNRVEADLRTS